MTDSNTLIIVAAITATPATIAAVLGFLTALSSRRAEVHAAVIREKMDELEKNTNSKMDKLVEVVATSEFAKGKLEAQAEMPAAILRQEENR